MSGPIEPSAGIALNARVVPSGDQAGDAPVGITPSRIGCANTGGRVAIPTEPAGTPDEAVPAPVPPDGMAADPADSDAAAAGDAVGVADAVGRGVAPTAEPGDFAACAVGDGCGVEATVFFCASGVLCATGVARSLAAGDAECCAAALVLEDAAAGEPTPATAAGDPGGVAGAAVPVEPLPRSTT